MFGKKLQKNIVPLFVAVLLAVNPFVLCASAALWEGTGTVGYVHWGPNDGLPYQIVNSVSFPSKTSVVGKVGRTMNGTRVQVAGVDFSSPVSIYVTAWYQRPKASGVTVDVVGNPYLTSNYEIGFKYADTGTKGYGEIKDIAIFLPNVEEGSYVFSDGIQLYARADASEARQISDILLRPVKECGFRTMGGVSTQGGTWRIDTRIIGAENAEELDALDSVASEIVEGNEILEAMKGDIVALLQDVYRSVGNMEVAMDQTQGLVNSILSYVDGLEGKLDSVNGNLGDIYSLLSGFFTQISKIIKANHDAMSGQINDFATMVEGRLYEIYAELSGNGTNGEITEGVQNQIGEGNLVQEGLGELDKIDPDAAVDNLYTPNGETEEFASVLSSFFENSLVMTMLMVSLSMSFVAYVLYGKR